MAIASSTQPSLRARLLPRFPAQVLAGNGMTITKSGGTYIFETSATVSNIPLTALAPIPANTLIGRDVGTGSPTTLTVSNGLLFTGAGGIGLSPNQRARSVSVQMGPTLSTGFSRDIIVPLSCIINRVTMLADVVGNVQIDIFKGVYSAYPPTLSICGSNPPTINSSNKSQDSTLAGWGTSLTQGDVLRFKVNTVLTITEVSLTLEVTTI